MYPSKPIKVIDELSKQLNDFLDVQADNAVFGEHSIWCGEGCGHEITKVKSPMLCSAKGCENEATHLILPLKQNQGEIEVKNLASSFVKSKIDMDFVCPSHLSPAPVPAKEEWPKKGDRYLLIDAVGVVRDTTWEAWECDKASSAFLGIAKPTPEGRRMMEARAKVVSLLFGGERFVPEKGQKCWMVNNDSDFTPYKRNFDKLDEWDLSFGNCFPTQRAAQAASEAMREYAEALRKYTKTLNHPNS